jgi:hypothetical protein
MVRPCVASGFAELAVSDLASMYPASDWSVLCSGPSWISARVRSSGSGVARPRLDRPCARREAHAGWTTAASSVLVSSKARPLASTAQAILLLGCPCRPRPCAAAGLCSSLYRATPERRTHGPLRGRPWSRRRLSACGWPARSVPAPKIVTWGTSPDDLDHRPRPEVG